MASKKSFGIPLHWLRRAGLCLILSSVQLHCLGYLARAGCGQLEIMWNRRPIPEVIADDQTAPEVRRRLEHVEIVRDYARERLGLAVADTYTSYSHLDREAIAWNVSASERLRLRAKTWWFPIVGEVPYLGFFSKAEATELRDELAGQGWDTIVSTVSAYSTLGWFDDPLVSPQMRYSEWQLAELVIHESTHATLWFPGDVSFNESFASFVGRTGALQFYREQFGADSPEYAERLRHLREINELSLIFRNYAKKLNDTYDQNKTDDWKSGEKYRLLEELKNTLVQKEPEFRTLNLKNLRDREWNNAHFLMYLRYESGEDFFEQEFDICHRQWPCFLQRMHDLESLDENERRKLLHAEAKEQNNSGASQPE